MERLPDIPQEEIIRIILTGTDEQRIELDQQLRLRISQYEVDPNTTRTFFDEEGRSIYLQLTPGPMMEGMVAPPSRYAAEIAFDRDETGNLLGVEVAW